MDNFPRHVLTVAAALALVLGAGLATQAAGGTARAPAVTHLVLNEVDYDNVGADNREFVEVFNGTGAPVDLGDKAVVLVNGLTGTEYTRVALGPNCLASNQYLVVMDSLVVPAPGAAGVLAGAQPLPAERRRAGSRGVPVCGDHVPAHRALHRRRHEPLDPVPV